MTMTPADLSGQDGPVAGGRERPDPGAKAQRRTFTTDYKLSIIEEYDAGNAESRGALLRRERLHTSHVSEWRRKRDAGTLNTQAKTSKQRRAGHGEVGRLRRQNERLEAELVQTRLALDITGKAHALLEAISESAGSRTKPIR
jgi:transposase-like protein